MSLRTKLTLFTVGFVLITSLAILAVSVFQIHQKEQRDIRILRANALRRLQTTLQNSVNLISTAVEDRIGTPEMSSNLTAIIKRLRKSKNAENADWIWVLDTGVNGVPIPLSSGSTNTQLSILDTSSFFQVARDSGSVIFELPTTFENYLPKLTANQSHLLWYAQCIKPGGWVLAAAAPLSNLDAAVNERTRAVEEEIAKMIKDRMFFSLLLLIACAFAIIFFSKILTNPVNKLVRLTESIAEGRRDFTERIMIKSTDEIGRLAICFNAMLQHVENSMNKLEETAGKYRILVENANSVIIRIDDKGIVLFINEYAQNLFGYAPAEIEGRNIAETIGKSFGDLPESDNLFCAMEESTYMEREHVTKNGEKIWIGWTNRSLVDKTQRIVETLCVGSDITKSKKAEELAELQQRKLIQADKLATLGILVSGVAHEINNPNNFIVLNAQTLQDMWRDMAPVQDAYAEQYPDYAVAGLAYRDLKQEIPGMLKGIADGALRIKRIVQNLKDFSRMEPGDMDQRVDIAKVIEAAQSVIGALIKKSTNHFVVHIQHPVPTVRGNFQRIEQIIINLITNACQATDNPDKAITISTVHRPQTKDISIAVSDLGKGIAAVDMNRIFDPFFTTKRDSGGTGLGLAISYSIAKDHGGNLTLQSEPGVGTVATLILPVYLS